MGFINQQTSLGGTILQQWLVCFGQYFSRTKPTQLSVAVPKEIPRNIPKYLQISPARSDSPRLVLPAIQVFGLLGPQWGSSKGIFMLETNTHTHIYIIYNIYNNMYIYIYNQQNTFLEGLIQTPYFSLVDLGLIFKLSANSSQNLQTISMCFFLQPNSMQYLVPKSLVHNSRTPRMHRRTSLPLRAWQDIITYNSDPWNISTNPRNRSLSGVPCTFQSFQSFQC